MVVGVGYPHYVRRPIHDLNSIGFKPLLIDFYFVDSRVILLEYRTRFVVLNEMIFERIKVGIC